MIQQVLFVAVVDASVCLLLLLLVDVADGVVALCIGCRMQQQNNNNNNNS